MVPLFLFQGGTTTGQLLAGEPAESLGRESPSARAAARNIAGDHAGTSVVRRGIDGYGGDGGNGDRKSTRSSGDCEKHAEKDASVVDGVVGPRTPRRRRDVGAAGFSQPPAAVVTATAAGAAAAAEVASSGASTTKKAGLRRDEPTSATGCLGEEGGQQGGASFQNCTDRGALEKHFLPSEGKAPFASSGSSVEQPASPCSVAPAWCCGDNSSLEDLVCWTKGLDYDAAVKGL